MPIQGSSHIHLRPRFPSKSPNHPTVANLNVAAMIILRYSPRHPAAEEGEVVGVGHHHQAEVAVAVACPPRASVESTSAGPVGQWMGWAH